MRRGSIALTAIAAAALVALMLGFAFRHDTPRGSPPMPSSSTPAPRSSDHTNLPADGPRAPRRDRRAADDARRRIADLHALRVPSATASTVNRAEGVRTVTREHPKPVDTAMPSTVGSGNQADEALGRYIKSTVHEQFVPLAGECFEELLTRKPGTSGRLVLSVSVVGDRAVGGVVESVDLDGTTLHDPAFSTCVAESMMSVQFAAPPDDREVTFTYPFDLSDGPPPADSSR